MKKKLAKLTVLILIITMFAAMTIPIVSANTQTAFVDVDPNAVTAPAINWAAANGIVTGGANNRFDPNDNMTRAHFVLVLWRMNNRPNPGASAGFIDVDPSRVVAPAINWAFNNGIVTGTGNEFNPDGYMTRAQMVLIMHRFLGNPAPGPVAPFTDVDQSAVTAPAINWAFNNGIVTGADNEFNPTGNITRAHVVLILWRIQCTPLPELPPAGEYIAAGYRFIGNRNTLVFHVHTCRTLPAPHNRIHFDSRQAAIDAGHRACQRCRP